MLRQHQVAHVFNAWTRMPPIEEQMTVEGSLDCADFQVARLLLKQGRTYEEAVQTFQPYQTLKEPVEETRAAAVSLVDYALKQKPDSSRPKAFVYVNNRLEGNALITLMAILSRLGLPFPFPASVLPAPPPPPTFTLQ
jgi:hypothetical protein